MKTWRMLSSGICLNLITLAVSLPIICHPHYYHSYHTYHQYDQENHDHNPHFLKNRKETDERRMEEKTTDKRTDKPLLEFCWRSSSQSWFHLTNRWVLSRRPPTAAHCLGCTTSRPGQTPPTAALFSPPSEIWILLSFNFSIFLQIFSKCANTTDCKCVALQQKRCRLKYFHSVNSSKVPNPMSIFRPT